VDPRKAVRNRPVALFWLSPDCKHFSKAKGGKPVEKHIRGLAWIAVRWAATVRPRVIMLENVEEFKTWGPLIAKRDETTGRILKKIPPQGDDDRVIYDLVVSEPGEVVPPDLQVMIPDPKRKGLTFKTFVNALKRQGYQVQHRELRACDYGAPTIRKRFFLIARCDGQPIIWPKPTHGDPKSAEVKVGVLKPWRTAAEIIDWSLPCPSIFERKKPLAANTLRRIARGIQRFVIDNPNPFIVRIGQTGFGGDRLQYPIDQPLTTITTKAEHLLVTPIITRQFGQSVGHTIDNPLGTITAGGGGKSQLVTAFLTQYHTEKNGREMRGQSVEKPVLTLDTSNRYGLVTSHMIKLRGKNIGSPVTDPVHTITAGGLHHGEVRAFLMAYYGAGVGQKCDEPLHTVVTKDRFGLVTVHGQDYQIVDIGMRMLEPRELFNANSFPSNYIIDIDSTGKKLSKATQVAKCGNSVPPVWPDALVRSNLPELCCGASIGEVVNK